MGGGHHDEKIEIPDYRIYKVEDVPELVRVQKELERKGLKDPWLRNEVWRYRPEFGTMGSRFRGMFGRGIKWGVIAFGITIGLETLIDRMGPEEHEHGHH